VQIADEAITAVRQVVDEFSRPKAQHWFFWGGSFVLLVLVAAYARTLIRERLRDTIYVALFALMAFSVVRNSTLLGIVCAPLAARALSLLVRTVKPESMSILRFLGTVFVGSTCVVFLYIDVAVPVVRAYQAPNEFEQLQATMKTLSAAPGEHRLFCEQYQYCTLAMAPGGIRIYMNSIPEAFPQQVVYDYDTARRAKRGWQGVLSHYGVNTVMAHEKSAFDKAIVRDGHWKRIATTAHYNFYEWPWQGGSLVR